MQAFSAYTTGMKRNQYTLRDVPEAVDRELRARAALTRESLNTVAIHMLTVGLGLGDKPRNFCDLDALAGTWVEDPVFAAALRDMDTVDKELWR
jgi:hypothetical protein